MGRVPRSKTALPALPKEFLRRPDLLAALDRGDNCTLTLICAPPGYGKTLLLAEWARSSEEPTAWVALDEEDDDPQRLWSAVLTSLVACPAVPASSRLRRLVVSRTTVELDFLTDLLDGLAALPERVRLVLDDVHHLRDPRTLHGLQMLVRSGRTGVRLVLAGRLDPALPVARLRMENQLCELRAEQLRFSAEESATLMERCGLRLAPGQTALLHGRTGGWVAGLRLAALSMRGHPEPDRFLAEFSGDERTVADYLVGEVLSRITEYERELLRRTSVCDPLPAALAAELSDREDAAEVLDGLERDTGLVVGTGPQRDEYRIQELLGSYLTADLHRHGPGLAAQLHLRAAGWWAGRDCPVEALFHAAQAGDIAVLTDLLHHWAPELAARGEHSALRHALVAVADGPDGTDPWLALASAQVRLGRGERGMVRAELRRARRAGSPQAGTDIAIFRTATERLAGAGAPPVADERIPDDPGLAALALAGQGAAHVAHGDNAAGRAALEAALVLAQIRHLDLLEVQCLYLLGVAEWTAGDQRGAAVAGAAGAAAAAGHGWERSPWAAGAHAVLAHAQLLRAVPGLALRAAAAGLRVAPDDLDPVIRFALRSARGAARFDTGDRTAGLLELQQARAEIGEVVVPAALGAAAALFEHHAALTLGHPTAAAGAAGWLLGREPAGPELVLMRARSEAAVGSHRAVRAAAAVLLDGTTTRPLLAHTVAEAWLLEAGAALDEGDRTGARHALHAALACAEPLDVLRPFATAGRGVRALLVDQLGRVEDPAAFAVRALTARQRTGLPAVTPLSARERDVLTRLPSLRNLDEIADDLAVSVNTIKSHVRAIYGKLGVSTRRTAVLTAHEQGLLV